MLDTFVMGVPMEDPTRLPEFLTVKEVAHRLRRSTRSVHQYIKDGKIKAIQYTSRGPHLIPVKELERFLQNSKSS